MALEEEEAKTLAEFWFGVARNAGSTTFKRLCELEAPHWLRLSVPGEAYLQSGTSELQCS